MINISNDPEVNNLQSEMNYRFSQMESKFKSSVQSYYNRAPNFLLD